MSNFSDMYVLGVLELIVLSKTIAVSIKIISPLVAFGRNKFYFERKYVFNLLFYKRRLSFVNGIKILNTLIFFKKRLILHLFIYFLGANLKMN